MTFRAKKDSLYVGDNGRVECGEHLGATARWGGRDLSGQKVFQITAAFVKGAADAGWTPQCETCGKEF